MRLTKISLEKHNFEALFSARSSNFLQILQFESKKLESEKCAYNRARIFCATGSATENSSFCMSFDEALHAVYLLMSSKFWWNSNFM